LSPAILADRRTTLRQFDQTFNEVKCFVTYFCNCGVKINSEAISATVETLTKQYDALPLVSVSDSFALLRSHGTSISWLYSLRESALFFSLWRQAGTEVLTNKAEQKEGKEKKEERPLSFASPSKEKENDGIASLGLNFAIEGMELSQEDVVTLLLPKTKREWGGLKQKVMDHSISIHDLQKTFGTLDRKSDCSRELKLLAQTGDGEPPVPGVSHGWVPASMSKIFDYKLLEQMRLWLPALLKLREVAAVLIT
jgi:hypothetical protein